MLVLIQIVGWLACGILAVLGIILGYSNLFRDDKGELPFLAGVATFVTLLSAPIGALAIYGTGENIKKDMERAATDQMIEDLRRAAKGY